MITGEQASVGPFTSWGYLISGFGIVEHLSHNQNPGRLEKGESQPEIGADIRLYIVFHGFACGSSEPGVHDLWIRLHVFNDARVLVRAPHSCQLSAVQWHPSNPLARKSGFFPLVIPQTVPRFSFFPGSFFGQLGISADRQLTVSEVTRGVPVLTNPLFHSTGSPEWSPLAVVQWGRSPKGFLMLTPD